MLISFQLDLLDVLLKHLRFFFVLINCINIAATNIKITKEPDH